MTSIFYRLIFYVYCLRALAATRQASFLSHLASCLLLWGHISMVCYQPSFVIYQLRIHAHHHHMATAASTTPFKAKVTAPMMSQVFGNVLKLKVWKLRLSKSNLWRQMTNSSGRYATCLVFMPFDVRFLFYFVWNLTFNNLNRMSKIWRPKTNFINSSTCGWPLAPQNWCYKLIYL